MAKKEKAEKKGKKEQKSSEKSHSLPENLEAKIEKDLEKILGAKAEDAGLPVGDPISSDSMPAISTGAEGATTMTLTLKGLDKRGRNGIYTGAAVSIRIPVAAFPNKTAPQTLSADGLAGPKEKRAPETKEERKARLAAMPKPTLAEKIAKREASLAALRAKAEREAQAGQASQPSL